MLRPPTHTCRSRRSYWSRSDRSRVSQTVEPTGASHSRTAAASAAKHSPRSGELMPMILSGSVDPLESRTRMVSPSVMEATMASVAPDGGSASGSPAAPAVTGAKITSACSCSGNGTARVVVVVASTVVVVAVDVDVVAIVVVTEDDVELATGSVVSAAWGVGGSSPPAFNAAATTRTPAATNPARFLIQRPSIGSRSATGADFSLGPRAQSRLLSVPAVDRVPDGDRLQLAIGGIRDLVELEGDASLRKELGWHDEGEAPVLIVREEVAQGRRDDSLPDGQCERGDAIATFQTARDPGGDHMGFGVDFTELGGGTDRRHPRRRCAPGLGAGSHQVAVVADRIEVIGIRSVAENARVQPCQIHRRVEEAVWCRYDRVRSDHDLIRAGGGTSQGLPVEIPVEVDAEHVHHGREHIDGLSQSIIDHPFRLVRVFHEERDGEDRAGVRVELEIAPRRVGDQRHAVVGDHYEHCLVPYSIGLEVVDQLSEEPVGERRLQARPLHPLGRVLDAVPPPAADRVDEYAAEEVRVVLLTGRQEAPRCVGYEDVQVMERGTGA